MRDVSTYTSYNVSYALLKCRFGAPSAVITFPAFFPVARILAKSSVDAIIL